LGIQNNVNILIAYLKETGIKDNRGVNMPEITKEELIKRGEEYADRLRKSAKSNQLLKWDALERIEQAGAQLLRDELKISHEVALAIVDACQGRASETNSSFSEVVRYMELRGYEVSTPDSDFAVHPKIVDIEFLKKCWRFLTKSEPDVELIS
jgi:hypothetical protein